MQTVKITAEAGHGHLAGTFCLQPMPARQRHAYPCRLTAPGKNGVPGMNGNGVRQSRTSPTEMIIIRPVRARSMTSAATPRRPDVAGNSAATVWFAAPPPASAPRAGWPAKKRPPALGFGQPVWRGWPEQFPARWPRSPCRATADNMRLHPTNTKKSADTLFHLTDTGLHPDTGFVTTMPIPLGCPQGLRSESKPIEPDPAHTGVGNGA